MTIDDIIAAHRDSRAWLPLLDEARRLDDEVKEELTLALAQVRVQLAAEFARRTIQDPRVFERLLRAAVVKAGASILKYWVRSVVSRIGVRRVLNVLEEESRPHRSA